MAHNEEESDLSSPGRNATERVLNTPELLRAVFDVLEPGLRPCPGTDADNEQFRLHRATLAACARVSLFVSQHALDVLWRAIDEIEWLLKVLPTVDYVKRQGIPTLTGDISASAWAHFQTFAVRIRRLTFLQRNEDMPTWTELVRKCPGQPLLPNLRYLHAMWVTADEIAISPIHNLLPPCLHIIHIGFCGRVSNEAERLLFEALVNGAPQLETLSWGTYFPSDCPPTYPTYLHGIGRHFPKLATLTWTTRTPQNPVANITLLRAISAMPSLRTLRLDINFPEPENLTFPPSAFESLHTLRLTGHSFRDVVEFVHFLRPPVLKALFLAGKHGPLTLPTLHGGISRLSANLPSTLTHFSLFACYRSEPPPQSIDKTIGICDILAPLLRFNNLEHVVLDPEMSSVLQPTDDDLASAGAAWPRLQSLNLFTHNHPADTTGPEIAANIHITVQGVVTLAQRCPQLSALSIPALGVFSPRIPHGSVVRMTPFVEHPLRYFRIGMLNPGEKLPSQLEAVLRRMFPLFADPAARYTHGQEPRPRRFVMTVPE